MVRQLKPTRTLLIGMSCSLGSHDEVSAELASLKDTEGMDVALAYDGLLVSGCGVETHDNIRFRVGTKID